MTKRDPFHDEDMATLAFVAALIAALCLFSFWHDSLPVLPPLPEDAPIHRPIGR